MNLPELLLAEIRTETEATRNLLSLVTPEMMDYAPHEKSMKMGPLAIHIAEMLNWPVLILNEPELDFEKMDYTPPQVKDSAQLLALYDANLAECNTQIGNATNDSLLNTEWTMRSGEHIIATMSRYTAIRRWVMDHIVHHRAQLGVYLRMNNVELPSTYGPTADTQM